MKISRETIPQQPTNCYDPLTAHTEYCVGRQVYRVTFSFIEENTTNNRIKINNTYQTLIGYACHDESAPDTIRCYLLKSEDCEAKINIIRRKIEEETFYDNLAKQPKYTIAIFEEDLR